MRRAHLLTGGAVAVLVLGTNAAYAFGQASAPTRDEALVAVAEVRADLDVVEAHLGAGPGGPTESPAPPLEADDGVVSAPTRDDALAAIADARAGLGTVEAHLGGEPGQPAEPAGPVAATATVLSPTSARLDWTSDLEPEPGAWRVSRDGTDSHGTGSWGTDVAGPVRSFTFTSLVPGTTYELCVQPVGGAPRCASTGSGAPTPGTPAPGTPAPGTPAPPGGDGTEAADVLGWGEPRFVDDFEGTALADHWGLYDGAGHGGNGTRTPSAWSVQDGYVRVTGDTAGNSGGMALQGQPLFRDRIETRMRASAGDGDYHPVLLLWPDAEDWPLGGEVDYAEIFRPDRQAAEFFLHFGADNSTTNGSIAVDATEWHNYAVEWTDRCITGYVDGRQFFQDCDPGHLPPRAMHATVQLDAFGGTGPYETSTMDVDWMRIYDGA